MPDAVSLKSFVQAAHSTSFSSRSLIAGDGSRAARLGNLLFSQDVKVNDATMQAFRKALSKKYGVLGERAFDAVLSKRQQLHKDLRARDVKAVLSALPIIRERALVSEIKRQFDADPKLRDLPGDLWKQLRDAITNDKSVLKARAKACKTQADIVSSASDAIQDMLDRLPRPVHAARHSQPVMPEKNAAPDEPTGLSGMRLIVHGRDGSVEDRMLKGRVGTGQRVNHSSLKPMLLDSLKTNGVEPGFIYKNDWSFNDTKLMMETIDTPENRAALDTLKGQCPAIARKCAGLPLREQIMLFGRAHRAGMAAVADYMLEKGMADPSSAIYRNFCKKFPGTPPGQWRSLDAGRVKKELFVQIRDSVMSVGPKHPYYKRSPVFEHFTERHILKLDYNESNRFGIGTSSMSVLMRPQRTGQRYGVFGPGYRLCTSSTADKISAGAVTEALANDLTRIAGVPAQELRIVRGEYRDGHPKLMLEATFAKDYSDIGPKFLKDGQVVRPDGKKTEDLGKYKAFFLTLADRDAVGSRGQNKGFSEGKFFAIDPGHSLEGNGKDLEIHDDLSFKDAGRSLASRFANYSIFDDDTRFAKLEGAVRLRQLKQDGVFKKLFDDYRAAFDPKEAGITAAEKALRKTVIASIDEKEDEFDQNLGKVLGAVENQLALYDAVASAGREMQEKVIETLGNLEKLTSPTTWLSPHKEVPLKHLSVLPETRIPWKGRFIQPDLVFQSQKPLSRVAQDRLRRFAEASGSQVRYDAGGFARLVIPGKSVRNGALDFFSENAVAYATHPEEALARSNGGTGLEEGKHYVPGP